MQKPVKIMLADDHQLIRDGLRSYLESSKHFRVVAEAANGLQVLNQLKKNKVDLVVMDLKMDVMDGIGCTKEVSKKFPKVKVLALTMYNEQQYIKQMIAAGASGYLLKNCGQEQIIKAIEEIMLGNTYYSAEVTQTIMNGIGTKSKRKASLDGSQIPLTEREKEVLELVIKEYSNQEIADSLFISLRTVDAHKRNLLEKTGSKNAAGLVKFALKYQLFDIV